MSNAKELLDDVPAQHLESAVTWEDQQTASMPLLGIQWIPSKDVFTNRMQPPERPITKRSILSTTATIFDPLGWVTPVVLFAKAFLQQLWLLKTDWDDELLGGIAAKWTEFLKVLPELSNLRLPRHLGTPGQIAQVHGFCDASELGFAAVVYLRKESPEESKVSLIAAKSKVAPLKRVSLPRLKLFAASLLTNLLDFLMPHLQSNYQIQGTRLWSDSTVVLHWLRAPPYKLKTFVANRVAQIQEAFPDA